MDLKKSQIGRPVFRQEINEVRTFIERLLKNSLELGEAPYFLLEILPTKTQNNCFRKSTNCIV
jgi:hypothetical protein